MRAAWRWATRGGRGADAKSSQLRIPARQSRSSVRYPTPGMWTKVSRSIRIGDPPPGDSRCARVCEPRKRLIRDARWPRVFEVRERDGLARIGVLETAHGPVTTPALLPVVNPNRSVIAPSDLASRFGAEILITNAYILGKSPRREAILRDGVHSVLECPRAVSSLDVAVCAIGGVVPLLESYRFRDLVRVILASKKGLDPSKPVHLFGAGHPLIFPLAILLGCDVFASASYAKYARDGRMLFPDGTRRASEVRESGCLCPVCTAHAIGEIAESEALLAEHNLHVCFGAIREARRAIAAGDLWELAERRARSHPALLDALRELRRHNDFLEAFEPTSRRGALYYVGPETAHRPILHRSRRRLAERYAGPPAKGLLVLPEGPRPFAERNARNVERVLERADVHIVVKSVWGPVPLELDHLWPMSQCVVPESLDVEALEAAEVFFREWAAGAGYPFGMLWEGDETLDAIGARAPGARSVDWNALRVRATADFQFGHGAADALLAGTVSYVVSKNTGKVRNVLVDGDHVLSLRAEDGFFTLKAAGALRLRKAFDPPALRIVVDPDAVPFVREGKNVFAKFVRDADPELRPGDEALIVSPDDDLCAVGQTTMNRREMLAFKRGVAARVREGVPPAPSAPRR